MATKKGIPKFINYRGKRYRRAYTEGTKRDAESEARKTRAIGASVIIRKYGDKYVLYAARR